MIKVKFLENDSSVVLLKTPIICSKNDSLSFSFEGLKGKAYAKFSLNGNEYLYRDIIGGGCEIPLENQEGELEISVYSSSFERKIQKISLKNISDKRIIYLDGSDLESRFIDCQLRLNKQDCAINELKIKLKETTDRLADILDGYDVV